MGPRLRLLRNHLQGRSITASEPFGLPTGSLTVMALISGNPGSSQKQLADWAGITSAGVVGVIDDLESRELVYRERSAKDRRRNEIKLTKRGERTMKTMFATVREIEDPIKEELGEEDMRLFISFVDRIVDAFERSKK